MYLFLFVLGAVFAAAGVTLGAMGVSVHDRTVDPTMVTPGLIAAIGGLILIGVALAVRALQRIERALATRPMPRAVRPGEAVGAAVTELANLPARIPFPPKPEIRSQPARAAAPTLAEDKAVEQLREKFATLTRLETAPVVAQADVPILPAPPARADEDHGEVNFGRAASRANGSGPAVMAPRLDVSDRPAIVSERAKAAKFNALWPRWQQPAQSSPARAATAPAIEPEEASVLAPEAPQAAVPQEQPAPLTILKSGVVDGMAYTLYSDGSIEAQLPQGTLRFGSITELRNHIEQRA
jgi:hypothetical protein